MLLILLHLLAQIEASYYPIQLLNENTLIKVNGLQLDFSIGYWFQYQPKHPHLQYKDLSNQPESYISTISGQLEMFMVDLNSGQFILLILLDTITFKQSLYFFSESEQNIHQYQMDPKMFEGIWYFQYISVIDSSGTISTFLFDSHLNSYLTSPTPLNKKLEFDRENIGLLMGGFGNIYNTNKLIQSENFEGTLSELYLNQIITADSSLIDLTNSLVQCTKSQQSFDAMELDGSQIFQLSSSDQFENSFSLEGWFKLENIVNGDYQLIKIRINSKFEFQQQLGDQMLVLNYIIMDNSVIIQCLSETYDVPIQAPYTYSSNLFVSQEITLTQASEWHYIGFFYDRFQITDTYFSITLLDNTQYTLKWSIPLYFFTGNILYFQFGDISSTDQIKGSLQNFQLSLCLPQNYIINKNCHVSCLDCYGPDWKHCTSCDSTKNRVLTSNGMCSCSDGYYSTVNTLDCFQISTSTQISILELENQLFQCDFGYFQLNNKCIQCPSQNLDYIISCIDCLINPYDWYLTAKCTYNYVLNDITNMDSIFQKQVVTVQYIVDEQNENTIQCVGCKSICSTLDGCNKSNYYHNGIQVYINCLDNFYFKDGKCNQCALNCLKCNESQCQQCESGYYLQMNQCFYCIGRKCESLTNLIIDCPDNQVNINNQCVDCGNECQYCEAYQQLQRCLKCNAGYHITRDGINCQQNKIDNCIDEFLDIHTITPLFSIDEQNIPYQSICMRCSTNLYDEVNRQCITNTNPIPNCSYAVKNNADYFCIIGNTVNNAIQITTCTISNCQQCVGDYCIVCDNGYYSNFYTGLCEQCQNELNCSTCQMDLKQTYFPIFAYYKRVSSGQILRELYKSLTNITVKCSLCRFGFFMLNEQCAAKCPSNCSECKIIDNQNVCISCKGQYGILQTPNCLACGKDCRLCETKASTTTHNPLFNSIFFTKYSNICLKQNPSTNNYYNQYSSQFMKCTTFEKCKQTIKLQFNIYCSSIDHELAYFDATDKKNFVKENIKLSAIDKVFEDKESFEFTDFLNKYWISQMNLVFNFIGTDCVLDQKLTVTQRFSRDVYMLNEVNLIIQSESTQLNYFSLVFQNFNQVLFKNINFLVNKNTIQFVNTSHLQFDQCSIKSEYSSTTQCLQFISPQLSILSLSNFKIENAYLNDCTLFPIADNIILYKLKILSSSFVNSYFIAANTLKQIQFSMNYVEIYSIFKNSNFINSDIKGINAITQLQIHDSQIEGINLFQIRGCCLSLLDSQIFSNTFKNQATFIQSEQINLKTITFSNLQLTNSNLIRLESNYQYDLNLITMVFNKIQTDSSSSFIITKGSLLKITINNLRIINLIQDPNQLSLGKFQLQGNQLEIYQFILERQLGHNTFLLEGFFNISIDFVRITQQLSYFVKLYPTTSCFDQYNHNLLYSSVFEIQNNQILKINDFIADTLNLFNSPLILINNSTSQFTLTNSIFTNNLMVISNSASQTALIQIQSDQPINININNNQFVNNTLNKYAIDNTLKSSATINIDCQNSVLILQNNQFQNNMAFNTTDTIMYLRAQSVLIETVIFLNNNLFDYQRLSTYLAFEFDPYSYLETISEYYRTKSYGGNGYIESEDITINNIELSQSEASVAACFYLKLQNEGLLTISNSKFADVKSSLYTFSTSSGGCLYIDASQSTIMANLNQLTFTNTFARLKGGAIYIQPPDRKSIENTLNQVLIQNVLFQETFAITGGNIFVKFNDPFSLLFMKNILSKNTQTGYYTWLSRCEKVTRDEVITYFDGGALVSLELGNVRLDNIRFAEGYVFGAINIQNSGGAYLNNILIENINMLRFRVIQLSLSQDYSNQKLVLQNVTLHSITDWQTSYFSGCDTYKFDIPAATLTCNPENLNAPTELYPLVDSWQLDAMFDCNNQQLLSPVKFQYSSIIKIMNVLSYLNQFVSIDQVTLKHIICVSECTNGMISFVSVQQKKYNFIHIKGLNILNNVYTQGILFYEYAYSEAVTRLLSVESSTVKQVTLEDILIQNNTAQMNLFFYSTKRLTIWINNLVIQNNTINQQNYILTTISGINIYNGLMTDNCNSVIKGSPALYSVGPLPDLQKTMLYVHHNKAINNEASDIYESPQSLTISYTSDNQTLPKLKLVNNSTQLTELVDITPFKILGYKEYTKYLMVPSGQNVNQYSFFDAPSQQNIPYNLSIKLIPLNRYGQIQQILTDSETCKVEQRIINELDPDSEINTNFSDFYNFSVVLDDDFSLNLNQMIIKFDPYSENQYLQLQFTCSFIQVVSTLDTFPYTATSHSNYQLRANFRTFPCQVGEYVYGDQCVQCDANQNQFQVEMKQNQCLLQDDASTSEVKAALIKLKPGFWRYKPTSIIIEECYHLPLNCEGDWTPGDASCAIGHIGGSCEYCDIYNIRGEGAYSISSKYKCGSCNDTTINIIALVLISIWTELCALVTVKSNVQDTEDLIIRRTVKGLGIAPSKSAQVTILLKILTNYFQIISTIFTFQLQLPSEIQLTSQSIGNPVESMIYSLECFLVMMTDIEITYFRIIWMLITPLIFMFLIYFFYFLLVIVGLLKYSVGVITTTAFYMYIYMQPNIIQGLISPLSRRKMSGVEFIQANVALEFNTSTHYKWLLTFILPSFIIFAVAIPIYLFTMLYYHYKNDSLSKAVVRMKWGYLYNEYTDKAYYWEIVKLIQKQFIIIALNYYEDYIPVKASLVLLIVFIYQLFSSKIRPYIIHWISNLDIFSTIVCSLSIIMCSSIYSASNTKQQEIIWPFYLITAILNIIFILIIIIRLIIAYFDQYQDIIDRIKMFISEKMPNLIERCPSFKPYLETKQSQKRRVEQRYKVLKSHLMSQARSMIKLKKLSAPNSPDRILESFYSRRSQLLALQSPYISRMSQHKQSTNTKAQLGPMISSLDGDSSEINSPTVQKVYSFKSKSNQQNSRILNSDSQNYFSRQPIGRTQQIEQNEGNNNEPMFSDPRSRDQIYLRIDSARMQSSVRYEEKDNVNNKNNSGYDKKDSK